MNKEYINEIIKISQEVYDNEKYIVEIKVVE